MQIVTGYEGQAHITSNDDQGRNQGTFGEASYVLSVGSKFAPTLLSANSLKIADGEGVHQGVHFRVDPSTYDTVTIDNGTQGQNRKDLVVCRYTKDGGTGIETCEWVVIKGTPSSGTATRPSHTTGDILNGSLVVDMPFFEISLSGINVSAVTTLFTTLKAVSGLQSDISTLNNSVAVSSTTISLSYSGVTGSVTFRKFGRVVMYAVVFGDGNTFSDATGTDNIGTVPTGYRPPGDVYMNASARTIGAWASATFYHCVLQIAADGTMTVRGNSANLKSCRYLVLQGNYYS